MPRIPRRDALIFGSNAGLNQIGQFGSLAAGSVAYTDDPDVIQSLPNYLTGWFGAIVGSNSPAIEDMNALCYLFAYQLAYIMEAGVPEYSATSTYWIGDLVSSGGTLYVSLTDSNTGNALTSSTNWFTPTQNGTLTPNALPTSMSLPASQSMTWANLAIATGQTLTVPNGANLIGLTLISVAGTGVLVATGTGAIRII